MTGTRRLGRTICAIIAAAAVGGSLGGCLSRKAAAPDRVDRPEAYRLPADAWPPRITDNLDQIVQETPERITRVVLDGTVPDSEINPDLLRFARRPTARIVFNQRYGEGIIRAVRSWDSPPSTRFVSFSPLQERPSDQRTPKFIERTRKWLDEYLKENAQGVRATDDRTLALVYEGTELRIRRPEGKKPVGLIVHMAGLGSMQYEQPVIEELSRRGWAVLRIATPSVWWFEGKPTIIHNSADIEPTAKRLARTIDDLVAEPAYAAEAALEYIADRRPDIPLRPLVMFGCSAGALAAPAVVARMPDKFDAAIFVAGGANLLKLSQTSDLTDAGIRVLWENDTGNAADRAKLYDSYLNASRLDPYHSARTMADKPVLVVQAALDSTVSAAGGDLLWEQLGRPERWTFTGGHRLLFWRLADQASAIADWVEHATGPVTPLLNRDVAAGPRPSGSGGGRAPASTGGGATFALPHSPESSNPP